MNDFLAAIDNHPFAFMGLVAALYVLTPSWPNISWSYKRKGKDNE